MSRDLNNVTEQIGTCLVTRSKACFRTRPARTKASTHRVKLRIGTSTDLQHFTVRIWFRQLSHFAYSDVITAVTDAIAAQQLRVALRPLSNPRAIPGFEDFAEFQDAVALGVCPPAHRAALGDVIRATVQRSVVFAPSPADVVAIKLTACHGELTFALPAPLACDVFACGSALSPKWDDYQPITFPGVTS